MKRRTLLIAMALVMAACGAADTADTADTTTSAPPAASTTGAEATTTTTTAATTTTSVAESDTQLATIRAAIAESGEVTSGRMEGLIEVTGPSGAGPAVDLEIPFSGMFDQATGNSSFSMDMSAMAAMAGEAGEEIPPEFAGMFGELEMRVVDGISYIKFPLFGLLFGAETPWISAPAEEGSSLTQDFTFAQPDNPADVLSHFEEADAEVTEIGRENVNGVDATHYRVVFDAAAMLDELPPEERAEVLAEGFVPDGEFPMDLWISDDGVVVRYIMEMEGAMMQADDDDAFERMVMTFDLLDINQPVSIEAPDPAEVTDMESLSGAFPGLPVAPQP